MSRRVRRRRRVLCMAYCAGCAAYHAAIAAISSSEKPLARRGMIVPGRWPGAERLHRLGDPRRRQTGQRRHRRLDRGACRVTARARAGSGRRFGRTGAERGKRQTDPDHRRPSRACGSRRSPHAPFKSWFISGIARMRLPVAAKTALSTAGAATAIVGSPTPPQKSPVGTMTVSTCGISSMRMTL